MSGGGGVIVLAGGTEALSPDRITAESDLPIHYFYIICGEGEGTSKDVIIPEKKKKREHHPHRPITGPERGTCIPKRSYSVQGI